MDCGDGDAVSSAGSGPRSNHLSRALLSAAAFPFLCYLIEKAQKRQSEELGQAHKLLSELSPTPSVVSWGKPHPNCEC